MEEIQDILAGALQKVDKTARRVRDGIPYRTSGGRFDSREHEIDWWTNGFWGGLLWLAYTQNPKAEYREWAEGTEKKLDAALRDFWKLNHDVGFMWHLTAVADYKLTGSEESARRGMKAAAVLASRFNPKGSYIRAWNESGREGWAIIDCMMNLAILYWASDYQKDPHYANIAQAHAEMAMNHFIYPDGSAKHICVFDAATGAYVENLGGQGYDANSAWSRGAAWALYGFALSAGYTGREDFLHTAERVANFFVSHLPDDFVPYADFKAPVEKNLYRDTSAAACAASGLALLAKLEGPAGGAAYEAAARKIVNSLYENYTDWENDEALLGQGCVAFHEKDPEGLKTSLIYGDYFFVEALIRLCGGNGLF